MLTIYIYGKFSENKTKLIYFLGNVISERDITVKNKAHSGEWAIFTSATLYDRMMAALLHILRRLPYDGGKGIISTAYMPMAKVVIIRIILYERTLNFTHK